MHVTRLRRERPSWRRARVVLPVTVALAVAGTGGAYASTAIFGTQQVGTQYASGLQVSADQVIKPLGERLLTQDGKFMGSTVSPDGRFLAASSTDKGVDLQLFDLASYKLLQLVGTGGMSTLKIKDGSVGQAGPTYSPDGRFLWLPQANGLSRFPVNPDGTVSAPTVFTYPSVGAAQPLPAKATYSADGSTLYVPFNGQNSVVAIDPQTGAVTRTWTVGTAPRQIAVVGSKLYVSNEGGRPAKPGESTIDSYGTPVPANPTLGTATTGTLTVIDTAGTAAPTSIAVGLHPTALYTAGTALFVANTNSDSIAVVDTSRDKVVQAINTQPWSGSRTGYQPNGIVLTRDGHLLVTLGRANAVAVYRYGQSPQEPVSYLGLLPTDYFPTDIAQVGNSIVVTNTRGIDARGPLLTFTQGVGTSPATGHGTHSTTASLTRFTLPSDKQIARYTDQVFAQNGWTNAAAASADEQAEGDNQSGDHQSGADRRSQGHGKAGKAGEDEKGEEKGGGAAPVAVPARIGDPSTIKHVFLLVKENRTYDQQFGDIAAGNGDPSLTQFGQQVTPNQHALAKQFGLYDNTYDIGTNSAEGHNWVMQGDNPAYTETSAGEYLRSYDTENDVLGHQRSGFLWTAVQKAGRSARTFGEFMAFENKPKTATWQQYYCATKSVEAGGSPAALTDPTIKVDDRSPIPSLDAIANHDYPQFDTAIPDLYRYQIWKQDFEKNGPANLNMFWLSSDHTSSTASPRAQVADNDLAVGRIVDEISHSPYWKDSAIFVVEDDSQAGADHVDGHRAPIQVISPYAQHGAVDHTFYSQITMVRTIEQILGAQPLNQKVAAATPMASAFTNKPDYTPFTAQPNQVPLTEGLNAPPACGNDLPTGASPAAVQAQSLTAPQQALSTQWAAWAARQDFSRADAANPEQMNRWTWYRTHRFATPYPGDTRLFAPDAVPGAYVPSSDSQ